MGGMTIEDARKARDMLHQGFLFEAAADKVCCSYCGEAGVTSDPTAFLSFRPGRDAVWLHGKCMKEIEDDYGQGQAETETAS